MSKAGLIQAIAEEHVDKLTLKDVKGVLESLTTQTTQEIWRVLVAWLRKVPRDQKAGHQGAQRY